MRELLSLKEFKHLSLEQQQQVYSYFAKRANARIRNIKHKVPQIHKQIFAYNKVARNKKSVFSEAKHLKKEKVLQLYEQLLNFEMSSVSNVKKARQEYSRQRQQFIENMKLNDNIAKDDIADFFEYLNDIGYINKDFDYNIALDFSTAFEKSVNDKKIDNITLIDFYKTWSKTNSDMLRVSMKLEELTNSDKAVTAEDIRNIMR